ncbi:Thiamine import ATP-binding protein ThiQ [Pseudoruegeria aquimaris]|uniref:Thiamine import ATP-binding protein ThiQ n=1 Tax=Pseudoruegeria aquimaris TaxID=393663 RepID=A0A1Y5SAD5_9RHOB|nr:ABC transporter ATP-binding protein [Pseudoruegeria aquimaris]SLN36194.1 Thiamine import ATP-binding protein ThiQ [Pseudoruegeria aquimaris]
MSPAPGIGFSGAASVEGTALFSGLTLAMAPGRWTCLLGASGVGKTTVLRLIAGLAAHVDFEGSITATDGQPLQDRIAYMAQSDLLLPWLSLPENVAIGARLRGGRPDLARARDLLARVGLGDHLDKRPAALSGGQRQRVALARTLMEDRPVILLDEPFSALDARTRADMQDLAATQLAGRTVLLVTHDPGEAARLGEAIHVMAPGSARSFDVPPVPVPRPVDHPDTLALQGRLHAFLRKGAPA